MSGIYCGTHDGLVIHRERLEPVCRVCMKALNAERRQPTQHDRDQAA